MRYSPEALIAFVEAADAGSFSAAARKLRKSQSTISAAIANLEADLGLTLFDRHSRTPALTPQGRRVLSHVQAILAASERLDALAVRLGQPVEPRLTLVLSDTYAPSHYETLLGHFGTRYPEIEYECMIAEREDVTDLLQQGRAHIGILESLSAYPPDIAHARLPEQTEMALYVARSHPLAAQAHVSATQLGTARQLCLTLYHRRAAALPTGLFWSAPSYLMLMEMAEQGFGWAVLPRWLVEQYGKGTLVALPAEGWPMRVDVDVVWSKQNLPGPAGSWFLDQLIAGPAASV
ncbi:LysR family transcriptional regulator [Nissabacter sp. SGAir0207]|uniref:LysR family transcriptional regulator n=1 Tax=Nissabacter sp. SGAir0207 TaxID=2126321 RepID=UPI0010CD204F|nr:LysR family transcriptional regulator [Nissabacter sp. SGAir0207]QCR35413.1 LysR family transcriptional regulator [Nissabacter sp. SGAir0207]